MLEFEIFYLSRCMSGDPMMLLLILNRIFRQNNLHAFPSQCFLRLRHYLTPFHLTLRYLESTKRQSTTVYH